MINQFRCCTDKTKSSSMILGREINQKNIWSKNNQTINLHENGEKYQSHPDTLLPLSFRN